MLLGGKVTVQLSHIGYRAEERAAELEDKRKEYQAKENATLEVGLDRPCVLL